MGKIFYTADWHLGSHRVIRAYNRPYKSIDEMTVSLVSNSNMIAADKTDTIIHVGDFACYKSDNGFTGLSVNPSQIAKMLSANFINVLGNHDSRNRVKSSCTSLRTTLGPFIDVSVSHYPSYDERSDGTFVPGDIHICGHVHSNWKHYIDTKNSVLNINVGVDVWDYKIVSEDMLVGYITRLMQNYNTPKTHSSINEILSKITYKN